MTSLAFVSLLLVAIVVSTASTKGGTASCCRKLSKTKIHRDLLKEYYKQDKSSCPINAVVFTTLKNKRICANPNRVWTKTSMAYIDGNNGQCQNSTFQTRRG
ncbi:monocyte chemotactic protein 1B-like isoform X1 [Sebastes umbrosus]|uniref:monocyte chemotactic protein 1B-like isoform X1 n=1 Tax=Sebastes umbrosus TaxID=72105 RepID=UPI00189F0ABD|nr:monocyte chemotactic protein 1B-like isoform X1 [Sebastes umbrosus]